MTSWLAELSASNLWAQLPLTEADINDNQFEDGQIMFDSMLYKDEENYPKNEMKIASKSSRANYDDLK